MPVITFECVDLTEKQKEELIKRFSQVVSEITHKPEKSLELKMSDLPDENLFMEDRL